MPVAQQPKFDVHSLPTPSAVFYSYNSNMLRTLVSRFAENIPPACDIDDESDASSDITIEETPLSKMPISLSFDDSEVRTASLCRNGTQGMNASRVATCRTSLLLRRLSRIKLYRKCVRLPRAAQFGRSVFLSCTWWYGVCRGGNADKAQNIALRRATLN